MATHAKRTYITLRGIVTPCAWDTDDTVSDICISSDAEEEFIVVPSGKGRDLHNHLRSFVQVKGVIFRDKDGRKMIQVKKYECIKPAADHSIYEGLK